MMGAACHSPAFWFVRTLPGVIDVVAAAYGTHDLTTAFDRLAVNRPVACGFPSIAMNAPGEDGTAFDQRKLHTHFNQDGTERTS